MVLLGGISFSSPEKTHHGAFSPRCPRATAHHRSGILVISGPLRAFCSVFDKRNATCYWSIEKRCQIFKKHIKMYNYKITPWLQNWGCCSWELIFLSPDESFNIGLKFEIAFEVRPRSSSGTLVHGHSVNGEYLNVHMKKGQVMG